MNTTEHGQGTSRARKTTASDWHDGRFSLDKTLPPSAAPSSTIKNRLCIPPPRQRRTSEVLSAFRSTIVAQRPGAGLLDPLLKFGQLPSAAANFCANDPAITGNPPFKQHPA